jgi:hypothetical protein
MTIEEELIMFLNKIETFDKDAAQDGNALHSYLIELTNIAARSNYLMADLKRQFRISKRDAYMKLQASSLANGKYFTPSLAKDYIDSCCSNTGYLYDLAERLSRTVTHTIDAIRTIISSLKAERQFAQF